MRIGLFLAVSLVNCAALAGPKNELSIRQTVLRVSRGPQRPVYSVPIRVGSSIIETGTDTGSIGLRILPNALMPGDVRPSTEPDMYFYGSGVQLDGVVGIAAIAFGRLQGEARLQLIRGVTCREEVPECPAANVGRQDDYGLMGQGIPKAGFRAIVGLRFAPPEDGKPGNTLVEVGARQWIIDLPRRGEDSGRLSIDPSKEDLRGFVELPSASAAFDEASPPGTVPGCLIDLGGARGEICGSILFDTGAPGIRVTLPRGRIEDWPVDSSARLVLGDGHGHALATEDFTAGPLHYGHVGGTKPRPRLSRAAINVGVTPFLGFSVLYDVERKSIAVRPRDPTPLAPKTSLSLDSPASGCSKRRTIARTGIECEFIHRLHNRRQDRAERPVGYHSRRHALSYRTLGQRTGHRRKLVPEADGSMGRNRPRRDLHRSD